MARLAQEQGWHLDLAILLECSFRFADGKAEQVAETLDGKEVIALARKARQYSTCAKAPVPLRRDGRIRSSVVILDQRVLHSDCPWEWPESRREEQAGRINVDRDAERHEYLVTSCHPSLAVGRFLETEGLLTGRQRVRRNLELLRKARGGEPTVPEPVEQEQPGRLAAADCGFPMAFPASRS
jgi:hypothetical protein